MKPSVYVETSVLSAYDDPRPDPVTQAQRLFTRSWWENERRHFRLFHGEAVLAELTREPFPGQDTALRLLRETRHLSLTAEVEGVAEIYQRELLMPQEDMGDAFHLATACVYEMEYLLTWNCKHLANRNKVAHMHSVNLRLALQTPTILTPQLLLSGKAKS